MSVRSKATQQATLLELIGSPIGAPLAQDPGVRDTILKFFDAEQLRDKGSVHRDRADRENEVFEDMIRLGANIEGVPRPVVAFADDDQTHVMHHETWLVANFNRLRGNEPVFFELLAHIEQHRAQTMEKQGQMLPGTSLIIPQTMVGLVGAPTPTVQQVAGYTFQQQQMQQQQAAMGAQAPQGNAQAPQAPRQPSGAGEPGGSRTDPAAPSGNTPSAASRGGAAA
jgi:hypothetical protein